MGKQLAIASTKQKHHRDISDAAEAYVDVRDKRMELSAEEHEAKSLLHQRMQKHGLKVYDDRDLELRVTIEVTEETVKVKKLPADAAPSESRSEAAGEGEGEDEKDEETAPEAPKSEPRRRSKPKGDGTRAFADGKTTEITDPKALIDLKDEGEPAKRKPRKKGKRG
ncbi:MAG TPA: hypothetical protein VGH28_14005 [Polyangiaceae bacterium]